MVTVEYCNANVWLPGRFEHPAGAWVPCSQDVMRVRFPAYSLLFNVSGGRPLASVNSATRPCV